MRDRARAARAHRPGEGSSHAALGGEAHRHLGVAEIRLGERAREGGHRREAGLRLGRRRTTEDGDERARERRGKERERVRISGHRDTGEHRGERPCERKLVRGRLRVAASLLRRHERGRAGALLRAVVVDERGEPEVGEVGVAALADQDVARLHVAVNDAAAMRVIERRRNLERKPHGDARLDRSLHPARQVRAVDVCGRDVAVSHSVEGDDVRMREPGDGAPLPGEEALRSLARGDRRVKELHRRDAAGHLVLGQPHLAHRAAAGMRPRRSS